MLALQVRDILVSDRGPTRLAALPIPPSTFWEWDWSHWTHPFLSQRLQCLNIGLSHFLKHSGTPGGNHGFVI